MRILLTGKSGQVGWELQRALAPLGEVIACDRSELDLANPDQIVAVARETQPQIIVNAAAYTAVDKTESESELAHAINARAPGILADEAKKLGALLVHYSTDYVFDGTKAWPYTEEDAPNPINVYGRTKLAGEQVIQASGCRHLIFRTSWVYGPRGKNFLLTILRLAKERDELRIVSDQIGAPTTSALIADVTAQILRAFSPEKQGLYNLTATGSVSWHGFAQAIVRTAGLTVKVTSIPTSEYPTPARRPSSSLLNTALLRQQFDIVLPSWEDGLRTCFDALRELKIAQSARDTPGKPLD